MTCVLRFATVSTVPLPPNAGAGCPVPCVVMLALQTSLNCRDLLLHTSLSDLGKQRQPQTVSCFKKTWKRTHFFFLCPAYAAHLCCPPALWAFESRPLPWDLSQRFPPGARDPRVAVKRLPTPLCTLSTILRNKYIYLVLAQKSRC